MSNALTNAGFMDGTAGWQGTSGLALAVDETVRGSLGRMVLKGTGTASASGQARWLSPAPAVRADISGAVLVEAAVCAAAFLGGAAVKPQARLVLFNAGGAEVVAYDLPLNPPALDLHGVAVAGLRDTFWRGYGVFVRPASAVRAALEVGTTSSAASQSIEVVMNRPYVGASPARRIPAVWGPGLHSNPDLARRNWPSDLPLVGREGGLPKPWAVAHDAGAGLPAMRRASREPVRKLTARVRADAVQRQKLEAFAAGSGRFWLEEPDTGKLCLAEFDAEGAPKMADHRGGLSHMELTLWLETA